MNSRKVQLEVGPGKACGPEDRGQDLQRVLVWVSVK